MRNDRFYTTKNIQFTPVIIESSTIDMFARRFVTNLNLYRGARAITGSEKFPPFGLQKKFLLPLSSNCKTDCVG